MMFKIEFYKTKTQNPINEFIYSLDDKTKIKVAVLIEKLSEKPFGLKEFSKKITRELFELRLYYSKKWHRILYAFEKDRIIILLHGFIKKSKRIPSKDIKIAEKRLIDYQKRKENNNG